MPVLSAAEGVPETGLGAGEDQQAAGDEIRPIEGQSCHTSQYVKLTKSRPHSKTSVVPVPDPDP